MDRGGQDRDDEHHGAQPDRQRPGSGRRRPPLPGRSSNSRYSPCGTLGPDPRLGQAPLSFRIEVPLPSGSERWERRAWDAMLYGLGERTAIELEMRLRDVQAVRRRHELKRRDDPTEHFLLLVADTRHNRRVVAEFAELFAAPRLRPSAAGGPDAGTIAERLLRSSPVQTRGPQECIRIRRIYQGAGVAGSPGCRAPASRTA